jgi:thioredoxin-like negative regulator of GroEL
MKKQLGLIAFTALLISFVAFTGVTSAQASNTQVLFFESPMCSVCQQVKPLVESAAAQTGAKLIEYDVSTSPGSGIAQANGVSGTPTIVIQGGQTLTGAVTQPQIVAAINAAAGASKSAATPTPTATPTTKVVKAVATPTTTPKVVKAATTPKVTAVKVTTPKATAVKVTTPKATKTVAKTAAQPAIQVATSTQTPTTSTQTVPEFSLLGLGAPALIVGAIYLFLRRR